MEVLKGGKDPSPTVNRNKNKLCPSIKEKTGGTCLQDTRGFLLILLAQNTKAYQPGGHCALLRQSSLRIIQVKEKYARDFKDFVLKISFHLSFECK